MQPACIDLVITDPPYITHYCARDGRSLASNAATSQLPARDPIYLAPTADRCQYALKLDCGNSSAATGLLRMMISRACGNPARQWPSLRVMELKRSQAQSAPSVPNARFDASLRLRAVGTDDACGVRCSAPTARDRTGSHLHRRQRPCCSPERCRACRCRTRPACRASPDGRGVVRK
jgi:hypothetical protein